VAAGARAQMIWRDAYNEFGRRYWTDLRDHALANIGEMARMAHVRRSLVYRKLHRFGVTLPAHRPANPPGLRWPLGRLRLLPKSKPRGAL